MIKFRCIQLCAVALFSANGYAQHPAPPPPGEVAPAPLPMEGKKRMEPPAPHGREKPTARRGVIPKPPVKPPTPEATAPDPVQ